MTTAPMSTSTRDPLSDLKQMASAFADLLRAISGRDQKLQAQLAQNKMMSALIESLRAVQDGVRSSDTPTPGAKKLLSRTDRIIEKWAHKKEKLEGKISKREAQDSLAASRQTYRDLKRHVKNTVIGKDGKAVDLTKDIDAIRQTTSKAGLLASAGLMANGVKATAGNLITAPCKKAIGAIRNSVGTLVAPARSGLDSLFEAGARDVALRNMRLATATAGK